MPDSSSPDRSAGTAPPRGFLMGIVSRCLQGPPAILVLVVAAVLGGMAVFNTPREEEPQIVVPMADVLVDFPGHSAETVEQLVTTPLERLMWQMEGVEHVYSVSQRDQAMVTVRFYVGQDRERAMVRVRDKIHANLDLVPPGVAGWLVRPVEIDDVPIVALTLHSEGRDAHELRRIAEEAKARMDKVRNVSRTEILGGYRREVLVEADIEGMAGRGVTLGDIERALARQNPPGGAGTVVADDRTLRLVAGPNLADVDAVRRTVVRGEGDRIVRVEDVARVTDGPEEPAHYVHIGFGPASEEHSALRGARRSAVTMAFSKKRGTNAVAVSRDIIAAAENLKGRVVPPDVRMLVTRDYGRLADEKVNDLLQNLLLAILTVVAVMTISIGWREGLVVGLAVPTSFAMALFCNFLFGYTINRVTLFALILSLGLVVDDPITNVDNIQRHLRMGKRSPFEATLAAVREVLPPVIMSTLAIIVSFTPMFFITGMMGPYMGPMAVNVPLTVIFSTVCALTFVPWLAFRLLKQRAGADTGADESGAGGRPDGTSPRLRRFYRAAVGPFMRTKPALGLLAAVALLLAGSMALPLFRLVPLKMLPFDNKDELQIVLDLPEGTSLERTDAAVRDIEDLLATFNEVTDFQSYVGLNSPIDFNGLVRHYGMRRNAHQADIRVNLAHKSRRRNQSHAIALAMRDPLTAVAKRHGALLRLVEVPPGPPVMATLVAEVRGRPDHTYGDLIAGAAALRQRLAETDARHIVEIEDTSEAPHERLVFRLDRDRAARHGLTPSDALAALRAAVEGAFPAVVHDENERTPLMVRVRLPRADRDVGANLGRLRARGGDGNLVPLAELGEFATEPEEQPVHHKNLERVVYVMAETVGRPPGEIVLDAQARIRRDPLPDGIEVEWAGEGEWEITLRVFRDLGIAFGVAMIGIYLLLTVQMKSFGMPFVVMMAIPLTAIGIMPGFFVLNLLVGRQVGGYSDPVFFTATAMIGMIALGGIVIRNSLVLVEFIQGALAEGMEPREAVLSAGAVRFRPIVLTALTTMIGAWPITLDPVFSGLAWALIFGLVASTLFTLVVVPAVYMMVGPKGGMMIDE